MATSTPNDITLDRGATPSRLQPGAVVGRFVILSELGAGGMGVVHLAYDPKLDRKIALKLLHERGSSHAARLLREAQALARLAHPIVVAVHDVGSVDDRVWLAMEYVEGRTLAEWLSVPRSWPEVVATLTAAGRGVEAAHAAGLVHRDLKPSNLIIGDDGRVRVMDFGLVRARDELAELDATGEHLELDSDGSSPELLATATRTGSLLGTPAYMAPEQFLGQTIDARTDQFSFCAVAWQALFGERPFAGDSVPELRYAVIHGRRRAPPSAAKVPGWLRDAIARGLAVDPNSRWPSMTALLDALASGRRRAWTRRVVVAGLAVVVLSGAGWFTTNWYRARELAEATRACEAEGRTIDAIWNDEVRAGLAEAFATSDSNLAADTWPQLAATIDGHTERWSSTRTQACVEAEVEDRRTPSALDSARACLDQRRAMLASFIDALHGAEHTVISSASLASARLESPEDCLDVGESARRVPMPEDPDLHERAAALRERLIQVDLGVEIWRPNALSEAEATLREAEELDFAPLLAEAVYQVGSARLRAGDVEAAEPLLERALFLAAEQGIDHLAVDAAARLGYCAYEQAQFEDGLRWIRVGEMLVRRSNEDAPLIEAHLHQSAGGLHERRGAFDDAIAEYQRTLEIYERVLPADHPDLGTVLLSACIVESKRGAHQQAAALCGRGLEIYDRSLPRLHPLRATAVLNVGVMYLDRNEPSAALPYLISSLELHQEMLPADHPDFGLSYTNLGIAYLDGGDPTRALPEFRRAIELWTRVLRPEHPILAYPLTGEGRSLVALGLHVEAIEPLERALVLRVGDDVDVAQRAETQFALARALWPEPEQRPRALELARAALETWRADAASAKQAGEAQQWLDSVASAP